mmetsp:Transcript_144409/g.249996  ORF Transcript_144409/g.249996 Transcript_144409/m.249996 type:complete len:237 (+) Transcript_144409:3-713(+)
MRYISMMPRSSTPELKLPFIELLHGVESSTYNTLLKLATIGVHLETARCSEVLESYEDLANTVHIGTILCRLGDHDSGDRAVLRRHVVDLGHDVIVVLVIHQILLVHSVQQLHHGAWTRPHFSALLHLHCQHRIGDYLLGHGVGHRGGCYGLRLRLSCLGLRSQLLHADDVLPAHEPVESEYSKVNVARVIVLKDPVALDLSCGEVPYQTHHPQLSKLAEEVAHNLFRHHIRKIED